FSTARWACRRSSKTPTAVVGCSLMVAPVLRDLWAAGGPARDVDVATDHLDALVVKRQGLADRFRPNATDRRRRRRAADRARRDESTNLVDLAGVEERPQHAGTTLNKDISMSLPAQFVEQTADGTVAGQNRTPRLS